MNKHNKIVKAAAEKRREKLRREFAALQKKNGGCSIAEFARRKFLSRSRMSDLLMTKTKARFEI